MGQAREILRYIETPRIPRIQKPQQFRIVQVHCNPHFCRPCTAFVGLCLPHANTVTPITMCHATVFVIFGCSGCNAA